MKQIYGLHNHVIEQDNKKDFLQECIYQKADVVAITDHRTLLSFYEIFSNLNLDEIEKYKNLKFIIGMELTGMFNFKTVSGKDVDIAMDLNLFNIDISKYNKLYEFICKNYDNSINSSDYQKQELQRLIRIAKEENYKADFDQMKIDDENKFAGRVLAYGLIDEKYVDYNLSNGLLSELKDNPRAFNNRECKNPDSKFYCDNLYQFYPTAKNIVKIGHEVGAKVILNHPAAYSLKNGSKEELKRAWKNSYKFASDFLKANSNVDGIESIHPSDYGNKDYRRFLIQKAKEYNLFLTGGTDRHKPLEKITKDYNNDYITNDDLPNIDSWAKLYSVEDLVELVPEIAKIELDNKGHQKVLK